MTPESTEVASERHFRSKPFRWCLPRFNTYVPADRRTRVLWNRYPHNIIGAALVVGGRCYGVRWKRSPRSRGAS